MGASGADIAVIEGVMGLFDGRGSTAQGSTAHVARLLAAPVILVVDASSQSRSVAALVHGFTSYDRSIRIAGIVLNRVASPRHEQLIREALASGPTAGIPVVGALPRASHVEVPSRHLGLIPAQERSALAADAVQALGALMAETTLMYRQSSPLRPQPIALMPHRGQRRRRSARRSAAGP